VQDPVGICCSMCTCTQRDARSRIILPCAQARVQEVASALGPGLQVRRGYITGRGKGEVVREALRTLRGSS
jgi:hypothetical protein